MSEKMRNFKKNDALAKLDIEYKFLQDSYEGGTAYRLGKYLLQHRRESNTNYDARLKKASYTNFCQSIIDINTSYLYKDEITRDLTGIEESVKDKFLKNADLEGRPWSKVVREQSKLAGVYGYMLVIVDKPQAEPGQSKGAELENEIRPYVATYTPRDVISYTFRRQGGRKVLSELILAEDAKTIRVWTESTWELWEESGTGKSWAKTLEGTHDLKRIPLAIFKNQDTFKPMSGKSDINDIADINKRIYYFDSTALQIIEDTGFAILEIEVNSAAENSSETEGVTIGTKTLLVRSEEDAKGANWIEAPHTSLPQIESWREQAIKDIRFLSKIAVGDGESATSAESGTALELRFQQLNALIVEKAENAEEFEESIFTLVALWDKKTFTGKITYPRRFGIRDLAHELDNAIKSLALVPSRTYQTEVAKKTSRAVLKDTDEKTQELIDKELESETFEDVTDESGNDDLNPSKGGEE